MSSGGRSTQGEPERVYEVRVNGLVPSDLLTGELAEIEVVGHEMRTVVSVRISDQAALHAFLHRLRTYGLELVEIRRLAEHEDPSGG